MQGSKNFVYLHCENSSISSVLFVLSAVPNMTIFLGTVGLCPPAVLLGRIDVRLKRNIFR